LEQLHIQSENGKLDQCKELRLEGEYDLRAPEEMVRNKKTRDVRWGFSVHGFKRKRSKLE